MMNFHSYASFDARLLVFVCLFGEFLKIEDLKLALFHVILGIYHLH